MSMHLDNPALTLTGKKKGKKKFASADAKRKASELSKEWEELKKKWETPVPKKKIKAESKLPVMSTARLVDTVHIPSRVTPGGDCTKKEQIKYTGTKVMGIATMHKSNAVPIFSDEEAKDISKMRR